MCGIAGVAYDNPADRAETGMLRRMADSIRHRGPDSEGFHDAPGIGLAFRRLSIIDLQTGEQPISNEDGSVVLVCNGEIYNYKELTRDLEKRGHRFKSASDAEVIVHLYEDYGQACIEHLRGMFALALWDNKQRSLMLARDRFGIKPLYYGEGEGGLYFGSEQKTILASGKLNKRLDVRTLQDKFSLGYISTYSTLFANMKSLPPAHYLVFCQGRKRISQYWDITFPVGQDAGSKKRSADEWAERLRHELEEAVRLHLRSDVNIGAWLSPGIDSSCIVSLMSRRSASPVETYTLAFEDPSVNEAGRFPTLNHYPGHRLVNHQVLCRKTDIERMPKAVWHNEGHGAGVVAILGQMLSERSAQDYKVVMSGEGSDELLGGYEWYRTNKLLAPLARLPLSLRAIPSRIAPIRRRWPGACKILELSPELGPHRYGALTGASTSTGFGDAIFSDEWRQHMQALPAPGQPFPLPEAFNDWHPHNQLCYLDLKIRMAHDIVRQLDSNSMANSLEVRVPFLDHKVAELAAKIPPAVKLKGFSEKYVLRRAMRDVLPPDILKRRKYPMTPPMHDWLNYENLPAFALDELSPDKVKDKGYFSPDYVAQIMREHTAGKGAHAGRIAMIINHHIWHDQFLAR